MSLSAKLFDITTLQVDAIVNAANPAISTSIYGYPLREATHIAVATVRSALDERLKLKARAENCVTPFPPRDVT